MSGQGEEEQAPERGTAADSGTLNRQDPYNLPLPVPALTSLALQDDTRLVGEEGTEESTCVFLASLS